MENPRTITDLPFEILDLVFKNLISLKCKVNLSQAHEKLGKAFAFHCRNKFRRLMTGSHLTPNLWAMLIRECGPTIEEYVCGDLGYCWDDTIADAIATHCPNLKTVSIVVHTSGRYSVPAFLIKVKNSLTSVTIDNEVYYPNTVLTTVSEMTQLKTLSFKGTVDEDVDHLKKLIHLEKLKIEHFGLHRTAPVHLQRICASLRNLRYLCLTEIKIMPFEDPHSKIWDGLESLTFNCCEFSEDLPDCPKLKFLDICYPKCDIEEFFLKFILRNGRNLKTLHDRCVPPIDADGFLQLLRGCPKLRYLTTTMDYIKLYSAYVSNIIEVLEANGVTREDPLELVICRRVKWKWFRRLLLRTPNAELIDLYEGSG